MPRTSEEILEFILDWMSRRLKMPKTAIDPRDSIAAYGVDSVMIAEFEGEISEFVGFEWPVTDLLLRDPSIREIAEHGAELSRNA
ncbi:MAG: acyl carrier protein [Bacteroidia bacterium]|nr:acyl carrier protein [Bacteroidia bacterium]